MTDVGITRTFIPLTEESQSNEGYSPGGHPHPEERDYLLALEAGDCNYVKRRDEMNHSRGLDSVIEVYKKDIDRTLIRRNLKLSHEERLQNAIELQRFAQELRKAGRRKK